MYIVTRKTFVNISISMFEDLVALAINVENFLKYQPVPAVRRRCYPWRRSPSWCGTRWWRRRWSSCDHPWSGWWRTGSPGEAGDRRNPALLEGTYRRILSVCAGSEGRWRTGAARSGRTHASQLEGHYIGSEIFFSHLSLSCIYIYS